MPCDDDDDLSVASPSCAGGGKAAAVEQKCCGGRTDGNLEAASRYSGTGCGAAASCAPGAAAGTVTG